MGTLVACNWFTILKLAKFSRPMRGKKILTIFVKHHPISTPNLPFEKAQEN